MRDDLSPSKNMALVNSVRAHIAKNEFFYKIYYKVSQAAVVSTEVSSWFELGVSSATFQDSPHCHATDELCHGPGVPHLSSGGVCAKSWGCPGLSCPQARVMVQVPPVRSWLLPLGCSHGASPQGAPSPHSALATTAYQLWHFSLLLGLKTIKNNYSWWNK